MEFGHVVVMGLHDTQCPSLILDSVAQEDGELEASLLRRVLYVAMTRAKRSVTLVGSLPFCRFFKAVPEELFDSIS